MLNVWDRWLRPPFKRQEICVRKMCVTVPFTTPYSVNIVWVSCLCVLREGACQSNAYRHMQSERNGWLAVMANKHIIHSVDPRDSLDLFAIWVCVQSNVLRRLLFMCLLCAIAACAFCLWPVWITCFDRACIQQEGNVQIYFSSLMSSFLNLSGKFNMSDFSAQAKGAFFQSNSCL